MSWHPAAVVAVLAWNFNGEYMAMVAVVPKIKKNILPPPPKKKTWKMTKKWPIHRWYMWVNISGTLPRVPNLFPLKIAFLVSWIPIDSYGMFYFYAMPLCHVGITRSSKARCLWHQFTANTGNRQQYANGSTTKYASKKDPSKIRWNKQKQSTTCDEEKA